MDTKPVIDHTQLVEFVRTSVHDVFRMMIALEPSDVPAYEEKNSHPNTDGILAFVGMAGTWVGTGTVSCSPSLACKLASHFLMGDHKAVDDDVLDAIGELTNIIIGNVKTKLEETVGPMGLSIPTVIYGRNFTSRTLGTQYWSLVPFNIGTERLIVHVCLAPQRESKIRMAMAQQYLGDAEGRRLHG